MPTYQTLVQDEKSSLLGSEFARQHPELSGRPLIVEHYVDGAHCSCDLERGSKKKRRAGCCARLCRFFLWMFVGIFALLFFLRHVNRRFQLPSFWGLGSPVEVPVAVTKCPSAPISYKAGELKYAFDVSANGNPNRFYFGQRWVRKPNAGPAAQFIQTAGDVIVQAASAGAADPVTVDLDIKLSHGELADAINIKRESAGLVIESETFLDTFAEQNACISVIATISVAPSLNISSFDIDTVVLPIELKRSLQLIAKNVFIHSTAGSVSSETMDLNSRRIEVETTSNAISGSFPLADLLSLKTVSGAVDVEIEPKEADFDEQDGTLLIRTASGNIQAKTVTTSIPNRNFTTQIHTVSGSVSGSFPLGVTSNVNSANGAITADFYTTGDAVNRSCIVNSVSGAVRINVHDDAFPLGSVRSNIRSQSGSVDVHLPAAWEGQIQGETKTGSVTISGDGVTIIKDFSPIPGYGRIVIAKKGDGSSNLSLETLNAPITVRVG